MCRCSCPSRVIASHGSCKSASWPDLSDTLMLSIGFWAKAGLVVGLAIVSVSRSPSYESVIRMEVLPTVASLSSVLPRVLHNFGNNNVPFARLLVSRPYSRIYRRRLMPALLLTEYINQLVLTALLKAGHNAQELCMTYLESEFGPSTNVRGGPEHDGIRVGAASGSRENEKMPEPNWAHESKK